MASVMLIGSEVIGECVAEIRIEVLRKILRMVLVCLPVFAIKALSALMDLSQGCVDGEGARYWRLICGLIGVTEEIKSPCGCRGFGWFGSVRTEAQGSNNNI